MYNIKIDNKFATDTLYSDIKSLNQNIRAQIFSSKIGYPIKDTESDTLSYMLKDFINDFGAPNKLTFDGAQAQVGQHTEFMKTIRRYEIKYHVSSPRRPNKNPAESSIREIKKQWCRIMRKKGVPPRIWDFGLVWICETGNITVSSSRYASG